MEKHKIERMKKFFEEIRDMTFEEFAEFSKRISRPVEKSKNKTVWDRISYYALGDAVEIARDGYNAEILLDDNRDVPNLIEAIEYICSEVYAMDRYEEIEVGRNKVLIRESDTSILISRYVDLSDFEETEIKEYDWFFLDGQRVSSRCEHLLKDYKYTFR